LQAEESLLLAVSREQKEISAKLTFLTLIKINSQHPQNLKYKLFLWKSPEDYICPSAREIYAKQLKSI
jgi:hypothetical protein